MQIIHEKFIHPCQTTIKSFKPPTGNHKNFHTPPFFPFLLPPQKASSQVAGHCHLNNDALQMQVVAILPPLVLQNIASTSSLTSMSDIYILDIHWSAIVTACLTVFNDFVFSLKKGLFLTDLLVGYVYANVIIHLCVVESSLYHLHFGE